MQTEAPHETNPQLATERIHEAVPELDGMVDFPDEDEEEDER